MNAFFLDQVPWSDDEYIISNHFDEIEMPMIKTSYQLLHARLVGMTYKEYLDFCKNSLGAKVVRKPNQKWASVYFENTERTRKFIEILNKKFEEGYK